MLNGREEDAFKTTQGLMNFFKHTMPVLGQQMTNESHYYFVILYIFYIQCFNLRCVRKVFRFTREKTVQVREGNLQYYELHVPIHKYTLKQHY